MGAIAILTMFGAVVVGLIWWLGHHVRREVLRRNQVARVRAAVAGHLSVAELRARCGADSLARYLSPKTPLTAANDPDPVAVSGSKAGRAV